MEDGIGEGGRQDPLSPPCVQQWMFSFLMCLNYVGISSIARLEVFDPFRRTKESMFASMCHPGLSWPSEVLHLLDLINPGQYVVFLWMAGTLSS